MCLQEFKYNVIVFVKSLIQCNSKLYTRDYYSASKSSAISNHWINVSYVETDTKMYLDKVENVFIVLNFRKELIDLSGMEYDGTFLYTPTTQSHSVLPYHTPNKIFPYRQYLFTYLHNIILTQHTLPSTPIL